VRYQLLMLAAMVEKFSFALALLGLHLAGSNVPGQVLAFGSEPLILCWACYLSGLGW
jgi:hypothetical protein